MKQPTPKTTLLAIVVVALLCAASSISHAAELSRRISYQEAAKLAVRAPRPEYPLEARQRKIMGSGVVLVRVDAAGGVTSVTMRQSTGSPILDHAASEAFKRWKFKSGQAFYFWQPVTFTMAGYSY
jgi:TonB family protein